MQYYLMKVYLLPQTALGKWSIVGIVGSIAFWLALLILRTPGQRSGDIPTLAILMSLVGISGISAFFTGIIGIIKSKGPFYYCFHSSCSGRPFITSLNPAYVSMKWRTSQCSYNSDY